MTLVQVRFIVELALFLLLASSILRRQPFSLQYARLHPGESWPPATFLRVNYVISIIWLIAFAAMTAADAAVTFASLLPIYSAMAIGAVALAIAVTFTLRYPALAARKLQRSA